MQRRRRRPGSSGELGDPQARQNGGWAGAAWSAERASEGRGVGCEGAGEAGRLQWSGSGDEWQGGRERRKGTGGALARGGWVCWPDGGWGWGWGAREGGCKAHAIPLRLFAKASEFALAAAKRHDPEEEDGPAARRLLLPPRLWLSGLRGGSRQPPPPRRPFRFLRLLLPLQRLLRPVSAVARCGGRRGWRLLACLLSP